MNIHFLDAETLSACLWTPQRKPSQAQGDS